MTKTVAILCSEFRPPWPTGRAVHVGELIDSLSPRGYQFIVLALGGEAASVVYNERTPVHYIPIPMGETAAPSSETRASRYLNVSAQAASYAQEVLARTGMDIDLVHCHDFRSAGMATALSERLRLPLVTTVHILTEHLQPPLGRTPAPEAIENQAELCRRSIAVIAVSRSIKDTILRYRGVDPHAVSLIYNGINPAWGYQLPPTDAELARLRESLGLQAERVILFAGRFEPNKGVLGVLQSAVDVTARHADVVYLIAGSRTVSDYTARCEALIASHPRLASRIRQIEHQDRSQLRLLYHLAEIVLVPSLYDGPALVVLEAMTAGAPTIASDAGGLPEVIEHERSGLLVPLNILDGSLYEIDVPKLVEAQERVLNSPALAARLSAGGRARVREHFRFETALERTAAVYEAAIGAHQQAAQGHLHPVD